MTSPFLTFAEVASFLRYELNGPNGAKAADACRKWLAKQGIRPSLKRGLYRLVQIEAVVDRLDLAQTRRRYRSFKTQASRFHQGHGAGDAAHLAPENVAEFHAATLNDAVTTTPYKAVDRT